MNMNDETSRGWARDQEIVQDQKTAENRRTGEYDGEMRAGPE
jgi:hypothetical protein